MPDTLNWLHLQEISGGDKDDLRSASDGAVAGNLVPHAMSSVVHRLHERLHLAAGTLLLGNAFWLQGLRTLID